MFRQLAQQMGMQTIRAILPSEIDACINIAINDVIKKLIAENLGSAGNEQVTIYNARVGQINGLSTLSKRLNLTAPIKSTKCNCYTTNIPLDTVMYITAVEVGYEEVNVIYDARVTQAELLGRTLEDYCNAPTYKSPVVVFLGQAGRVDVEVYTSSTGDGLIPTKVNAIIISKPAVVMYSDVEGDGVDCDMPDYMHIDIVKAAAEIYLRSVGITSN
nr:MAG TPA: hypothetical protein [Crassvirales sp.]